MWASNKSMFALKVMVICWPIIKTVNVYFCWREIMCRFSKLPFNINHAKVTGYQGNQKFCASTLKINANQRILKCVNINKVRQAIRKYLKYFELKPDICHSLLGDHVRMQYVLKYRLIKWNYICTQINASNWHGTINNCHEAVWCIELL